MCVWCVLCVCVRCGINYHLYKPLVDDYGFQITNENYYPGNFNNFEIGFAGDFFLLRYYNDRNVLSIEIANLHDKQNWYALSFIKYLIYNPDAINADEKNNKNRF